ncbi:hypothetical protein [Mesorhizobium sp.]|uniref:hypothetical protein n=1 Tax=Mesorhizobium sp. TaxID=1871066 RepID=UPI000FE8E1FE|nr:hypothetical protein [Mesorhizobium sp.]RWK42423.1 MAG: hypothetical protein EOR46_11360 [Mesorhizobium sp.]RWK69466.1 MAG: hypothetical protein EOR54_08950 [Mesorhizobium sp.]RWK79682.1 MAG: hypothetical protein EOR50_06055 [Mesorhizobium sp.]RWK82458.1 MAG: hypothetical protein EOR51_12325 [Mesorhizobium sp.]RWL08722.1 MAG: hypothetical protein EOR55_03225 [Mesorhizobium sp.]
MLLLGWACALRRSELVALVVADIAFTSQGALVTIRRSKTDQEGAGREIAVPFGRTRHCPIAALKCWLDVAAITAGLIFLGTFAICWGQAVKLTRASCVFRRGHGASKQARSPNPLPCLPTATTPRAPGATSIERPSFMISESWRPIDSATRRTQLQR